MKCIKFGSWFCFGFSCIRNCSRASCSETQTKEARNGCETKGAADCSGCKRLVVQLCREIYLCVGLSTQMQNDLWAKRRLSFLSSIRGVEILK